MSARDHLAANTTKQPDGCWLWTGSVLPGGYGVTNYEGKRFYVHRLSYEAHIGPIPAGLQIDHLCRVRNCLNPDHLEAVTSRENTRRGFGPGGIKARQTHCVNGHEFTPENTYRRSNGCRTCKACVLASNRRRREARAS